MLRPINEGSTMKHIAIAVATLGLLGVPWVTGSVSKVKSPQAVSWHDGQIAQIDGARWGG